jgi:hypothetical protein
MSQEDHKDQGVEVQSRVEQAASWLKFKSRGNRHKQGTMDEKAVISFQIEGTMKNG